MSLLAKCGLLATGVVASLLSLSVAAGCYDVLDPTPGSGLLSFDAVDTATADGASLTPVTAVVDPTLPLSQRVVTMSTTAGTFAPGGTSTVTISPDSNGLATAYLQAPRDTADAYLSASADTTTGAPPHAKTITYFRAQADFIDVIPDYFHVTAGITNSLTITAHLRRNFGRPSPFLGVSFRAYDLRHDSLGLFTTALPSDSSGHVTVRWTSANAADTGRVTIRAWATNNTTVFGETVIEVVQPPPPGGSHVTPRNGNRGQ